MISDIRSNMLLVSTVTTFAVFLFISHIALVSLLIII